MHHKSLESNETRIDVYETLCPQQMLVHKGGKIKNWNSKYQGRCEQRSEVFVKIQKKNVFFFFFFFFFLGGGGGGSGGCE